MRLWILAFRSAAAAAMLLIVSASTVEAQIYESVGVRAQGMGGAFVAVADDATASWWNPAGLAGGAYFNSQLEFGSLRQPDTDRDASGAPRPAWQNHVRSIAAAYPALAVSYYRLQVSEIQPASTASIPGDRQDLAAGDVRLRSLILSQFGVTFGQSVGDHLVLASTVKLLWGSLGTAVARGAGATLSSADSLEGNSETKVDLDAGVMVSFSHIKLGLAGKNLSRPTFRSSGVDQIELQRQARGGISFSTDRGTKATGVRVAADADLTRTATVVGDQRHVAAGVEAWSRGHAFTARGGVTVNTLGEARPAFSTGASVRLRSTAFVDTAWTAGSDETLHGWSVGIRVTY